MEYKTTHWNEEVSCFNGNLKGNATGLPGGNDFGIDISANSEIMKMKSNDAPLLKKKQFIKNMPVRISVLRKGNRHSKKWPTRSLNGKVVEENGPSEAYSLLNGNKFPLEDDSNSTSSDLKLVQDEKRCREAKGLDKKFVRNRNGTKIAKKIPVNIKKIHCRKRFQVGGISALIPENSSATSSQENTIETLIKEPSDYAESEMASFNKLAGEGATISIPNGKLEKTPPLSFASGSDDTCSQYFGIQPSVKFRCFKCGKRSFKSISTLQQHSSGCAGKLQPSTIDNSISSTLESSQTNLKITRRVFLCSSCRTYYQSSDLYVHMKEIHGKQICLYCLVMFTCSNELWKHLMNQHNVCVKRYECLESMKSSLHNSFFLSCYSCNALFSDTDNFMEHDCGLSTKSSNTVDGSPEKSNRSFANLSISEDDEYYVGHAATFCHVALGNEEKKKEANKQKNKKEIDNEHNQNILMNDREISPVLNQESKRGKRKGREPKPKPPAKPPSSLETIEQIIEDVVRGEGKPCSESKEQRVEKEMSSSEEHKIIEDSDDNLYSDKNMKWPDDEFPQHSLRQLSVTELRREKNGKLILKFKGMNADRSIDPESLSKGSAEEKSTAGLSDQDDIEADSSIINSSGDFDLPDNKDDIPAMALTLDERIECAPIKSLLRECIRTACANCVYCFNAVHIAVNVNELIRHLIQGHKFVPTKYEQTFREVDVHLKNSLTDMKNIYLNVNNFDSCDPEFRKPFEKIFICFQCHFSTSVQRELYMHKRKMHFKNTYICFMCKSSFANYGELYCHLCPGVFKNIQQQYYLEYRCCFCHMDNIPSSFRLMIHLRMAHKVCDICLEQCEDKPSLHIHLGKHKLHHWCYKCGIVYRTKADINKHLFWKHGAEGVMCKKCLQKKWPYIYHFCTPLPSYSCEECNLEFTKPISLTVHKRLHSNQYPYCCEECGKKFVSKKLLEKHKETHRIAKANVDSFVDKEITDCSNDTKDDQQKKNVDVYDLPPLNLSSDSEDDRDDTLTTRVDSREQSNKENIGEVISSINADFRTVESMYDSMGVEMEEKHPPQNLSDSEESAESLKTPLNMIETEGKSESNDYFESDACVTASASVLPEIKDDAVTEISNGEELKQEIKDDEELSNCEPNEFRYISLEHDYFKPCEANDGDEGTKNETKNEGNGKHSGSEEEGKDNGRKKSSRHRRNSSSSCGSSTDSDSSSSCGSNCSCSHSSSSFSGTSDTECSDGEHKEKRKRRSRHQKGSGDATLNTSTSSIEEDSVVAYTKSFKESDLDTDVSSTEEDFYATRPLEVPPVAHPGSGSADAGKDKISEDVSKKNKKRIKKSKNLKGESQTEDHSSKYSMHLQLPSSGSSKNKHKRNHPLGDVPHFHSPSFEGRPFRASGSHDSGHKRKRTKNKFYGYSSDEEAGSSRKNVEQKMKRSKSMNPNSSRRDSKSASRYNVLEPQRSPSPSFLPRTVPVPPSRFSVPGPSRFPVPSSRFSSYTAPRPVAPYRARLPSGQPGIRVLRPVISSAPQASSPFVAGSRHWSLTTPRPITSPSVNSPLQSSTPETGEKKVNPMYINVSTGVSRLLSESEETADEPAQDSSTTSHIPSQPHAPIIKSTDNLYCYCQCPYDEVSEMIACDGPNCKIEWYHFECVGIMVPPKGKWFCPSCRKGNDSRYG